MEFSGFSYAAPPATGERWIFNCIKQIYGTQDEFNLQEIITPCKFDAKTISLTSVRHPCEWLRVYYENFYKRKIFLGFPLIDELSIFPNLTWEEFITMYIDQYPGRITEIFNLYPSSSVMRFEDQPWVLIEILKTLGIPRKDYLFLRFANSPRNFVQWEKALKRKMKDIEREVIECYGY